MLSCLVLFLLRIPSSWLELIDDQFIGLESSIPLTVYYSWHNKGHHVAIPIILLQLDYTIPSSNSFYTGQDSNTTKTLPALIMEP